MIIDDGREINNEEEVPFRIGGVYKRKDGSDYYILIVDLDYENYYNLVDLERGIVYYDNSLDRDEIKEDLNNFYKYIPNAKLSLN